MKVLASFSTVCLAALLSAQQPFDAAKARETVDGLNKKWSKARLAYDRATLDAMLGPNFTVKIGQRTMSRDEYLKEAAEKNDNLVWTRFDVDVLTVQPGPDGSIQTIFKERLVIERKGADGKAQTISSVQVGRDVWKETAGNWQVIESETYGYEFWLGVKPPASVWD